MWGRSEIEVPGLGRLRRGWWGGGWHGALDGVRLRLAEPELAGRAREVLADRAPLEAALRSTLADAEVEVPRTGQPVWEQLELDGAGALAIFAVPWDDEHRWGVRLDATGLVLEVIISP